MTWSRLLRRLRAEARLLGLAAWRALVHVSTKNDLTHAAAIAYYALLSLFPFLLIVISLLGSVAASEADRATVLGFLFKFFPTQFDFLTSQLDAFRQSRLRLGVGGALTLVWASLGVFGAITTAVDEAWGVERQRNFWQHRMVSFLMMVAAGGVMLLGLLLVSVIQVAQTTWFGEMLGQFTRLAQVETLVFRYLATLLLILAMGLVFYFIPNARVRFRNVWVGAVLTGLLWRIAFAGFAAYFVASPRLNMIHGSIAAVVVFLFWTYVSAVILMYGVEFTASYGRLRRRRPEPLPAAPAPRI